MGKRILAVSWSAIVLRAFQAMAGIWTAWSVAEVVAGTHTLSIAYWLTSATRVALPLGTFLLCSLLVASPGSLGVWLAVKPSWSSSSVRGLAIVSLGAGFSSLMLFWSSQLGFDVWVGVAIGMGLIVGNVALLMLRPEWLPALALPSIPLIRFAQTRMSSYSTTLRTVSAITLDRLFGTAGTVVDEITVEGVMFLLLMSIWVFGLVGTRGSKAYPRPALWNTLLLGALLILGAMSVPHAIRPAVSALHYAQSIVLPGLWFLFVVGVSQRAGGRRATQIGLMLVLLVTAGLGLQQAVHRGALSGLELGQERLVITSLISIRDSFYVPLLMPFGVALLVSQREHKLMRFAALISCVLGVVLWAMETYTSVALALIVQGGLWLVADRTKRKYVPLVGIAILLAVLLFAPQFIRVAGLLRPEWVEPDMFELSTYADRIVLWEDGIETLRTNWAWGIGFNNFAYLGLGLWFVESASHSLLLDMSLSAGIAFGMLFAAFLFAPLLRSAVSLLNRSEANRRAHQLLPCFIALAGYLAMSAFDMPWYRGRGLVVCTVLGLMTALMDSGRASALAPSPEAGRTGPTA